MKSAAKKAVLQNLATNLIIYEKIKTTGRKGRALRPFVEKLITTGKINNLTNRRVLLRKLYLKNAINKVLEVLGPRYKDRKGGYTRITNLTPRKGDGAEMVQIEFINSEKKK